VSQGLKISKREINEKLKRKKLEQKGKTRESIKLMNNPIIQEISPGVPVVYGGKDL